MSVYCWGSSSHGELGLGGIDDENITTPQAMDWLNAAELKQAACGPTHTLLLTNSGKVFSCGSNDYGQLGQENARKRPQLVAALENYSITQVACGNRHSMAINEWGQLFTWGCDEYGQLGQEVNTIQSTPKLVKALATKHIVQIACGQFHCLVLLNNGDLYAWGSNVYGQLGLGMTSEKVTRPTLIKSLSGIPFAFICCGGNHCFALTKSGAVFGFGKNTFGQLGINDQQSKCFPTHLKTLRRIGVRFIACGDDFSVFLTQDGGVFTCGSGTFGQLGHGNVGNEILPRMVMELMGSTISQITCGRRHTLALVPSRGRIYGFGIGGSGQLGNRNTSNASTPQVVIGPWVSPSGVAIMDPVKMKMDEAGMVRSGLEPLVMVSKIFAGGDHCIVATDVSGVVKIPADYRLYDARSQILFLTLELVKSCSEIQKDDTVDLELISTIEVIFKSLACLNASFLTANDAHYCCTGKNSGVDIEVANAAFDLIRKVENDSVKQIIWDSITIDLIPALGASPADVEMLRVYLSLPLYHEFINAKNYVKLQSPFGEKVMALSKIPLKIITGWWTEQTREYFERLVDSFKGVVSFILHAQVSRVVTPAGDKQMARYDRHLVCALNILLMLFRINHQERKQKVPYECFNLPEVTELLDVRQDYILWLFDTNPSNFHLCSYPFLFDASAKMMILQTDQAVQMHNAMQAATAQSFMTVFTGVPSSSQYIVLNVARENIVEDTIRELANWWASDLKKPLKVKFHGEEAEDAGGVKKEFFMLLLRDILDPKYGMFEYYDDSRSIWFAESSFEDEGMYTLIGILCGLAIYNFTIINLPFPMALYKKLLKENVDLSDLRDLSPALANSMQCILDYADDDLEAVFDLTFEITRECFGETKNVPLKQDGANTRLTQANKQEFVDLYIDFVFNKSVEKHFKGFRDGFMRVCGSRVLELFKPHELMAAVIGNEDYDWHVMEETAEYKNGYESGDQTIRWFWEVFHDLSLDDKKRFLLFLTGSDRIPIQGMKAVKIFIQPTTDNKFLPVAHTCFNLLDLPRYQTKEKLKYKLTQAIQQTQGFSLV